jgi:hypothetical protein
MPQVRANARPKNVPSARKGMPSGLGPPVASASRLRPDANFRRAIVESIISLPVPRPNADVPPGVLVACGP